MASRASFLDAVRQTAGRMKGRAVGFLRLPTKKGASPEPFSAIVDETPSADSLFEPNAAMQRPKGKRDETRARIDFREFFAAILRNKLLLAALVAVLAFLLILAATAIIVNAPPKPIAAALFGTVRRCS